jgi:hypothetical protein
MASIYVGKLVMLKLATDATTDINIGTSATWLTSLLDLSDRTDALSLVLACSPSTVGALPPPPTAALVTERRLVIAAICTLLHATPDHLLAAALAKLDVLTALGVTISVAAGGMALRTAAFEKQAASATAPASAATAPAPAAPAAAPAASTSPRDVLLAAQAAELAAFRAGVAPLPTPEALAPSPLEGMDLLRLVSSIPGTSAPSDLQLFVDVGGDVIIRRLASLAWNPDPIIAMTGPGSLTTAKEAGADFASILGEARAAIPAGSMSDAVLRATVPPVDAEESASRVRTVIRIVEQHRRSVQPSLTSTGGSSSGDGGRHRTSTDRGTIKSIPMKAEAERAWRACSAAVINALGSADETRKATLHTPLSDPIAEARRLIDLHGNKAAGVLLSSGEADSDITHDPHPSILAARTALANHAKQHTLAIALPSRAKEIAAEALLLRESVTTTTHFKRLVSFRSAERSM